MADKDHKSKETISVTIDGELRVLPKIHGRTIIDVCDELGIDVPRFCYHRHLSIPANCRMCLVEVEGAPKLLPSCHTLIADGMVIETANDRVKKARRDMLELLLVSHPVDCPICDQAGECPLQDQYYQHDLLPSMSGPQEEKVKKGKAVRVGPRVTLDQERCVLCTRCTRFMDEIAGEPQLGMFWRNDHAYIAAAPGRALESNYSLNAVAICPVGALTSTDFRFKKRVWELKSAATICDGCSRGCNAWLDIEGKQVHRYRARDNDSVNRSWMCDHGMLSYRFMNEKRLLLPRMGRGAEPAIGTSLDAVGLVAARLRSLVGEARSLAVLVSAGVSTEDALAAAWFASQVMKADRIFVGGREEGEGDGILLREDRNPGRLGLLLAAEAFGLKALPFDDLLEAVDAGEITVLHAVGADVPTAESLAAEVFSSLEYLVVQAANETEIVGVADVALPAATQAEYDGSFVNFAGRLQRFCRAMPPRAEATAHWDWIAEIARHMGREVLWDAAAGVWEALGARSEKLSGVSWDEIGNQGIRLAGIGAPEEQTGGRSVRDERGVSRWPR